MQIDRARLGIAIEFKLMTVHFHNAMKTAVQLVYLYITMFDNV